MKNKIQDGQTIDHTPSSNVASGAVVVIGARLGIAVADILANETGSLETEGVFELAKKSADTFVQGAVCYWDATAGNITSTTTSNTLAGYVVVAAAASTTTVQVKINA